MSGVDTQPRARTELAVLHLQAGGCGGCGLEFDAMRAVGAAALAQAGLRLVDTPRHADLLLVSGTVGRTMLPAVEAAWAAMAEPRWLLTIGACALDGGPFRDGYAVAGGIATRLPVAFAIPGCPPTPDAILDGLRQFLDARSGPAASGPLRSGAALAPSREADPDPAKPAPRVLLPAAPRHPLAGGDSSAG